MKSVYKAALSAAPVQAGSQPMLVPESACRVCIYLHKGECTHSHGPLNPSGDYCGGQVLTRKTQPVPGVDGLWLL